MKNKKFSIKGIEDEKGDYIYRFEIKLKKQEGKKDSEELLIDTICEIISALLEISVFTSKGKEVNIDGFKIIGKDENIPIIRNNID